LRACRLTAVEAIDVERPQLDFDELQELSRQLDLLGFIGAQEHINGRYLAGGDLLADLCL
jgi:hypothetical protein